jgi:hypothetical protein
MSDDPCSRSLPWAHGKVGYGAGRAVPNAKLSDREGSNPAVRAGGPLPQLWDGVRPCIVRATAAPRLVIRLPRSSLAGLRPSSQAGYSRPIIRRFRSASMSPSVRSSASSRRHCCRITPQGHLYRGVLRRAAITACVPVPAADSALRGQKVANRGSWLRAAG